MPILEPLFLFYWCFNHDYILEFRFTYLSDFTFKPASQRNLKIPEGFGVIVEVT